MRICLTGRVNRRGGGCHEPGDVLEVSPPQAERLISIGYAKPVESPAPEPAYVAPEPAPEPEAPAYAPEPFETKPEPTDKPRRSKRRRNR